MTSISIRASLGSRDTSTVALAGAGAVQSGVHLVHGAEVVHVREIHRCADHVIECGAGGLEDLAEVLEDAVRLGGDIPVDECPVAGSSGICPETKSSDPARMACE